MHFVSTDDWRMIVAYRAAALTPHFYFLTTDSEENDISNNYAVVKIVILNNFEIPTASPLTLAQSYVVVQNAAAVSSTL